MLVAHVDGPITPVVADYLADGVRAAERGGYQALLVEMDTPGGLDTSMRTIIRAFLGADVPVATLPEVLERHPAACSCGCCR